ncbi:hypothetical protein EON71_00415 [bacterium]|nr:MAG: hypothetical protein EON71_00415 [bacterium]
MRNNKDDYQKGKNSKSGVSRYSSNTDNIREKTHKSGKNTKPHALSSSSSSSTSSTSSKSSSHTSKHLQKDAASNTTTRPPSNAITEEKNDRKRKLTEKELDVIIKPKNESVKKPRVEKIVDTSMLMICFFQK